MGSPSQNVPARVLVVSTGYTDVIETGFSDTQDIISVIGGKEGVHLAPWRWVTACSGRQEYPVMDVCTWVHVVGRPHK